MAVLGDNDRVTMVQKFAQDMSGTRTAVSIVKADMRAAVSVNDVTVTGTGAGGDEWGP